MKINNNLKLDRKPRRIIWAVALVILIIASLFAYTTLRHRSSVNTAKVSGPTINYSEATPNEKKESEARKDAIVESKNKQKDAGNPTSGSQGKKAVTPVITLARFSDGAAEIRAFVPGIYENDGTCTLTLSQNDKIITRQAAAIANASTTDCQQFLVNRSDFPSGGTWSVAVAYSSSASEGKSTQNSTVEIK